MKGGTAMKAFYDKGENIEYTIVKTNRKTISIKVTADGNVILALPIKCSEATLQTILSKKSTWIVSKVNEMKSRKQFLASREYENGESLKLLGNDYNFIVIYGNYKKCSAKFDNKLFTLLLDDNIVVEKRKIAAKETLTKLYREIAKVLLKERTDYYSKLCSFKPARITIKEQKSVWGSCSSIGNINYNWKIIMASLAVVDYIVVHELCHLVHHNHSSEYWKLVESILPQYKECKKWLKENGGTLTLDYIHRNLTEGA